MHQNWWVWETSSDKRPLCAVRGLVNHHCLVLHTIHRFTSYDHDLFQQGFFLLINRKKEKKNSFTNIFYEFLYPLFLGKSKKNIFHLEHTHLSSNSYLNQSKTVEGDKWVSFYLRFWQKKTRRDILRFSDLHKMKLEQKLLSLRMKRFRGIVHF